MVMMPYERRLQVFLVYTLTFGIVSHALVSPSSRKSAQMTTTRSFIELIEPETKCRVVLLGCLHGSQSSASDVIDLFSDESGVDTVVLELCASRVADLKRQKPVLESQNRQFSVGNFFHMVMRTSQQRGWGSGIAAAILGGASGLQTALSGFEAGLEFTTALDLAKDKQCDVVLADQAVDETLRRVGSLPLTSLSMLFQEQGFPVKESEALKTAIVGDDALRPFQVNMANVLTRNDAVVQDLLKLTLPPLAMALLAVSTAESFVNAILPQSPTQIPWWTLVQDFDMTPVDMWNSVAMDVVPSVAVLFLGYVTLVLPATRIILCERDDQLTDGIRAACRNASTKEDARVVAVLGLLHVNGVAKRLLQPQDATMKDK